MVAVCSYSLPTGAGNRGTKSRIRRSFGFLKQKLADVRDYASTNYVVDDERLRPPTRSTKLEWSFICVANELFLTWPLFIAPLMNMFSSGCASWTIIYGSRIDQSGKPMVGTRWQQCLPSRIYLLASLPRKKQQLAERVGTDHHTAGTTSDHWPAPGRHSTKCATR